MLKKTGYFFVILIVLFIAYFQYSTYQNTMVSEFLLGCKNDDIGDIFTSAKHPNFKPAYKTEDKYLSYIEIFKRRGDSSIKKIEYHFDSLKKSVVLPDDNLLDESAYIFSDTNYIFKIDRENLYVEITNNPAFGEKEVPIRNLKCEKIDKSVFLEEKKKVISKYKI